jgi:hypothetical protein
MGEQKMIETTKTESTRRRPLIAGVLRKTFVQPGPANESQPDFTPGERRHVRAAVRDGRDVRERMIDHVVECLLDELTW